MNVVDTYEVVAAGSEICVNTIHKLTVKAINTATDLRLVFRSGGVDGAVTSFISPCPSDCHAVMRTSIKAGSARRGSA